MGYCNKFDTGMAEPKLENLWSNPFVFSSTIKYLKYKNLYLTKSLFNKPNSNIVVPTSKYSNIHLNQHGTEILSTYIKSHLSTITAIRKKCYGCHGQDGLIKNCLNISFLYKCNICNICKEVTTTRNHMCYIGFQYQITIQLPW